MTEGGLYAFGAARRGTGDRRQLLALIQVLAWQRARGGRLLVGRARGRAQGGAGDSLARPDRDRCGEATFHKRAEKRFPAWACQRPRKPSSEGEDLTTATKWAILFLQVHRLARGLALLPHRLARAQGSQPAFGPTRKLVSEAIAA